MYLFNQRKLNLWYETKIVLHRLHALCTFATNCDLLNYVHMHEILALVLTAARPFCAVLLHILRSVCNHRNSAVEQLRFWLLQLPCWHQHLQQLRPYHVWNKNGHCNWVDWPLLSVLSAMFVPCNMRSSCKLTTERATEEDSCSRSFEDYFWPLDWQSEPGVRDMSVQLQWWWWGDSSSLQQEALLPLALHWRLVESQ